LILVNGRIQRGPDEDVTGGGIPDDQQQQRHHHEREHPFALFQRVVAGHHDGGDDQNGNQDAVAGRSRQPFDDAQIDHQESHSGQSHHAEEGGPGKFEFPEIDHQGEIGRAHV